MVFSDGLRRLRSAPQFRFDDVAAASGLSARRLRHAVASRLVPRGCCAQAAAVAVSDRAAALVSDRAAALTHRACPPYAVHAAGFTQDDWQVTSETPGAAGWAIRGASSVRDAHRSAVVQAALYGGDYLRERAVTNRSCPTGVRARLVEDPSKSVRCAAAVSFGMAPASAQWVLAVAAISDDADVRRAVAGRVDCPQHLLNTLAADPDSRCRSEIASCREVPEPVLRRFAHDPSAEVRNALARRRPLAAGTAAVLAEDSDVFVRVELARNETCPPDLLERLADDTSDWVRRCVQQRGLPAASETTDQILTAVAAQAPTSNRSSSW